MPYLLFSIPLVSSLKILLSVFFSFLSCIILIICTELLSPPNLCCRGELQLRWDGEIKKEIWRNVMKLAHLAEGRFDIIRSILSLYINSITNDDYVTSYAAVCCPMTCFVGSFWQHCWDMKNYLFCIKYPFHCQTDRSNQRLRFGTKAWLFHAV